MTLIAIPTRLLSLQYNKVNDKFNSNFKADDTLELPIFIGRFCRYLCHEKSANFCLQILLAIISGQNPEIKSNKDIILLKKIVR